MTFTINSRDYMEYIGLVAKKIADSKDYITEIDAATGDGDHWVNMNMGFMALVSSEKELAELKLSEMFKQIGKKFISVVGGSSGILYGSAYLEAAKVTAGLEVLDPVSLCNVLEAMTNAIMRRGNTKPGDKTMVDTIYPAVQTYKLGLQEQTDLSMLLLAVKQAAIDGAESTKNMVAVKGRAYYQTDKGIGFIDPGAVTMSYQLFILMDYVMERMTEEAE